MLEYDREVFSQVEIFYKALVYEYRIHTQPRSALANP